MSMLNIPFKLWELMNKTLAITAITFVAVVMGLSAVAPVIPYIDASDGGHLPAYACDYLRNIPNPSPQLIQNIAEHCSA